MVVGSSGLTGASGTFHGVQKSSKESLVSGTREGEDLACGTREGVCYVQVPLMCRVFAMSLPCAE